LAGKIHILAAKMYILPAKMHILAAKMKSSTWRQQFTQETKETLVRYVQGLEVNFRTSESKAFCPVFLGCKSEYTYPIFYIKLLNLKHPVDVSYRIYSRFFLYLLKPILLQAYEYPNRK
jgi:hypothetical protein